VKPDGLVLSLAHLWDSEDQAVTESPYYRGPLARFRIWKWKPNESITPRDVKFDIEGLSTIKASRKLVERIDLRIIHWGLLDADSRKKKFELYTQNDPDGESNGRGYRHFIEPHKLGPFKRK